MNYLFKKISRSLTPVLFIEYPLFGVIRGSPVRQVIQSCLSMFDNDADLLADHLVVVITHLPSKVQLSKIKDLFEDIKNAETEENTDELLLMLEYIINGIEASIDKKRKTKMFGRILLFDPENPDMRDKINAAFRVKPLEDPGDNFQVRIPSKLRNALEVSLQKSKLSIPVWLRDNNIRALSECLELLHRLAPSIPDVKCTYDDCAQALHKSIEKNLLDCKIRFSELLNQPYITHERDIVNILTQRNLLVNLSGVRAYMDPVETVEEFDDWVLDQIKQYFKKSLDATDFCEIRMKIENMDKISSLLGNAIPGSVSIGRDLTASVEEKVKNLESQIIDVEISESNILQIENSLYKLRQAIDEVQKFLTKKYEFKYVVVHINEGLDRKYWILSSAIRGVIGLQQFDKVQIEHYQLIKTVSNNKNLRVVLDEHPTSEEYNIQNHRSESPSKSFTERRYQCLKEVAVTTALHSIGSLKQIKNPSSALEISSSQQNYCLHWICRLNSMSIWN
eukprot:TRINITY_DN2559_c0_g1_i3.p1 TRINITY_DN2559_c0_g1~~TRINITY_DN2559_c0_g1_i3.p1  ORF type:complete len:507 (-),score=51.78 TRINITY_DN2559_c0_g1_i3:2430-3950(-)